MTPKTYNSMLKKYGIMPGHHFIDFINHWEGYSDWQKRNFKDWANWYDKQRLRESDEQ